MHPCFQQQNQSASGILQTTPPGSGMETTQCRPMRWEEAFPAFHKRTPPFSLTQTTTRWEDMKFKVAKAILAGCPMLCARHWAKNLTRSLAREKRGDTVALAPWCSLTSGPNTG